jgi:hypothetical protein
MHYWRFTDQIKSWIKSLILENSSLLRCDALSLGDILRDDSIFTLKKTRNAWPWRWTPYSPTQTTCSVTQHHIPEDLNLQQYCCEILKSHTGITFFRLLENIISRRKIHKLHIWELKIMMTYKAHRDWHRKQIYPYEDLEIDSEYPPDICHVLYS